MKSTRCEIAALILGLFAAGCDLFSTRDAEPPDTGRSTWETPREPSDVLDNLASAIFERNTVNYMKSFDPDEFSFEADQVTLSRDPSVSPWNYNDEGAHVTRLFSEGTLPQDSVLYVVLTSPTETIYPGDSAEIRVSYELNAGVAVTGVPRQMAGTADFFLHMGHEGYWQIYRWRDTRTEDQDTWSDLKSLVR